MPKQQCSALGVLSRFVGEAATVNDYVRSVLFSDTVVVVGRIHILHSLQEQHRRTDRAHHSASTRISKRSGECYLHLLRYRSRCTAPRKISEPHCKTAAYRSRVSDSNGEPSAVPLRAASGALFRDGCVRSDASCTARCVRKPRICRVIESSSKRTRSKHQAGEYLRNSASFSNSWLRSG